MIDLSLWGRRHLPFVAATEGNECGLACLACVSEFFEGEQGLTEIRRSAAHSGRGTTLLDLRDLAERIGLSTRALRIEPRHLERLSAPAILHWQMDHFVVLERTTRRGIIIMDPAMGRAHVSWQEVHESFTGVALELQTSERWKIGPRARRRTPILDLIGPLSRWRSSISLIIVLSLMLETLVLITPLQMQMSVDTAVQAADGRLVWVLAGGFSLLVLIQACVSVMRAWTAAVFSSHVNFSLHDRFMDVLQRKPARFFLKYHTADILNRARSVDAIQTLLTGQGVQVLLDSLVTVVMVVVMLVIKPLLALIVVGLGVLNMSVTALLRRAATDNSRRQLRVAARTDSLFLENARAARAIALYGKQSIRTGLWRNKFIELTNIMLAGGRLQMYATQGAALTNGLGNVLLISAGTYWVLDGALTLGTMMMFFIFKTAFVERLGNCVNFLMQLRVAQTHAERIEEVIGAEEGDRPHVGSPWLAGPGVGIEVRGVWFRYGDDSPWILQDVSFTIKAGESVAITGPSGSGKTTLMNIMLGLLEPSRGEVLIDGRNLQTISADDYSAAIGVVLQDDILFNGTIADNIAFFDSPLDMERIARAAGKANIAREIQGMPMQYYSVLAEGGTDISGGQKQRLLIARALYRDPKILYLDEATSHLDVQSERQVSQSIRAMNLTRVLIAHRRETIATVDRVLALSGTGTLATDVAD